MRVICPMKSCEMWDNTKIILGCAENDCIHRLGHRTESNCLNNLTAQIGPVYTSNKLIITETADHTFLSTPQA